MNNIVRPNFKIFFLNKVFMGPVNNARVLLEKQKNALLFVHGTHSASYQKKKKKKKKKKKTTTTTTTTPDVYPNPT